MKNIKGTINATKLSLKVALFIVAKVFPTIMVADVVFEKFLT